MEPGPLGTTLESPKGLEKLPRGSVFCIAVCRPGRRCLRRRTEPGGKGPSDSKRISSGVALWFLPREDSARWSCCGLTAPPAGCQSRCRAARGPTPVPAHLPSAAIQAQPHPRAPLPRTLGNPGLDSLEARLPSLEPQKRTRCMRVHTFLKQASARIIHSKIEYWY